MTAFTPRILLILSLLAILCRPLVAQSCPCDGDVNQDGIVNVNDWICIQDCKGGDCSCCLVSCDINCDGVVDDQDAGEDPLNEDSAWRCLFIGLPPATCCPGPTGACCDLSTGVCQDGVVEIDCTGVDLVWSEGLVCSQVSCPAPPTGACCYLGNGMCQDGVVEADCLGADYVWTSDAPCSAVECSVPPQDPCPCDGDVNDDGFVNVIDSVCIQDCKAGDCSCCPVTCDINCDGVVDDRDAGDDPLNDDSVWYCLFIGSPVEVCCAPTGACCDLTTGVCEEGVIESECTGTDFEWSEGLTCAEVTCSLPPSGACCNLATGNCEDFVLEGDCTGADFIWSEGLTCSQVSCPAPPAGACCYLGNGVCRDDVIEANCAGGDHIWTQGGLCSEIECSVPPQDPCPCDGDVNDDGAVNVHDWLCIQECKAGDCSCCPVTCDINCSGTVDSEDAGDEDPRYENTAWSCLFRGAAPSFCCPEDGGVIAASNGPYVPSTSAWGLIVATLVSLVAGTLVLRSRWLAHP